MTFYTRETMRQAGYEYAGYVDLGLHMLRDIETRKLEVWGASKNFAGYAIKYKNTHLEFMRSPTAHDMQCYDGWLPVEGVA